ncbi:hypothetical protein F5984_14060 [Rudanella paleaurantiibacter]|uniref:DUF2723 domain-containing protein n=1 Tax=Rudanella paleaurantiibacter TaxID=2614655 RepID=A0A7J5TYR2_9BACT|nr:hypothetical protein [Rudanella paleaurantiibacter]KAB7730286.1 hypothetical protein F5984_14060 [Rudanella paleaurantiibacter]
MTGGNRLLLFVWLVLGGLLAGLSLAHSTHATSPDSLHYLRLATDLRTYDGTFPPGYPLLIMLVSYLTHWPVLWASKLVNWLALGVSGVSWAGRIGPKRAAGLLALWLLPGSLRVAAYTWSETVFVVLLLEVVWQAHTVWYTGWAANRPWQLARLVGVLVALVMVRYVGLFAFIGLAGLIAMHRPVGRWAGNARAMAWALCGALVGTVLLLAYNYSLTGYWAGGPRIAPTEPARQWLRMAALGFANEVLLYNYRPGGNWLWFSIALLGQGCLGVILYRYLSKRFWWPRPTSLATWMAATGVCYWLTLIALRTLSPFDPLTERLMMPGSHCVLVAVVLIFGQSQHSIISKSPARAEIRTNPS